jgi:BspA type Leucine rich repeat region (6 copies)
VESPGGLFLFNDYYILPNSVTNIGDYAFYESGLLTSMGTNGSGLILPDRLLSIGNWAFYDTGLRSAIMPNSLVSIRNGAFESFELTNILIPNGVANIGNSAFYGAAINGINIPISLSEIESNAFGDCFNLASITIPNNITNIGDSAFVGCLNLTNIIIGNGVCSIGNEAFLGDALTTVTIPANVVHLGEYAFQCLTLTNIYFLGNTPAADSTIFALDPATVYYLPWTTGWGTCFGGVPTAPGSEQLAMGDAGVQTNGFGFTMVWTGSPTVIVQACTNLANPVWLPVTTNALANGVANFADPQWANYPNRFYRVNSQDSHLLF